MANSIRKFRERAGLTQVQFAEKLNISLDSVRRYESGDREPRWSDIAAMCALFAGYGCSPEKLMAPPEEATDCANPTVPRKAARHGRAQAATAAAQGAL